MIKEALPPRTRAGDTKLPVNGFAQVERSAFDPQIGGFQYYIAFNPNMTAEEDEVAVRIPVEVAISIGESGELADFTFELPKNCRSDEALALLLRQRNVQCVEGHVFVTFPGQSGDTVARAAGRLELDVAGRIIGMDILWTPAAPEA